MQNPNIFFESNFTKGWTDETLWKDFHQAQWEGDFFEMDCILRAQGSERKLEDTRVPGTHSNDLDLLNDIIIAPEFDSQQRGEEYGELLNLATLRDIPLDELPSQVRAVLKNLSYFAQFQMVDPYIPEKDYMETIEEFEAIQRGENPLTRAVRLGSPRHFQTGRDLATFVHDDNPMINWMPVVAHLLKLDVPKRTEFAPNLTVCNADGDFTCWGGPKFIGMLGEIVERVGHLSFRQKWWSLIARPEEYGYKQGVRLLSQAFPEGSPMHPSFTAMHAFLAYAQAYLLLEIFDKYYVLPNNNTVQYEINLWAENIAYARLWAGVHFASDNEAVKPRALALAKRVAAKHLQL